MILMLNKIKSTKKKIIFLCFLVILLIYHYIYLFTPKITITNHSDRMFKLSIASKSPETDEPNDEEIMFYVKRSINLRQNKSINYSEFKQWRTFKDRDVDFVGYMYTADGTDLEGSVYDPNRWVAHGFLYSRKGACRADIVITKEYKLDIKMSGWFCFNGLSEYPSIK